MSLHILREADRIILLICLDLLGINLTIGTTIVDKSKKSWIVLQLIKELALRLQGNCQDWRLRRLLLRGTVSQAVIGNYTHTCPVFWLMLCVIMLSPEHLSDLVICLDLLRELIFFLQMPWGRVQQTKYDKLQVSLCWAMCVHMPPNSFKQFSRFKPRDMRGKLIEWYWFAWRPDMVDVDYSILPPLQQKIYSSGCYCWTIWMQSLLFFICTSYCSHCYILYHRELSKLWGRIDLWPRNAALRPTSTGVSSGFTPDLTSVLNF